MAQNEKGVLLEHTQRYVREVMADLLRREGFVSKDGEDVHWFRIINNEVLHAVYFLTPHSATPIILNLAISCTPLFIHPLSIKGVYRVNTPGYEQVGRSRIISKQHNDIYRIPDVMVHCPADEHKGRDLLEQAILESNVVSTPRACYEMHKQWHSTEIKNGMVLNFSPHFVDEVLFWQDQELYPICSKYVLTLEHLLTKAQERKPLNKADQKLLVQILERKSVLMDGQQEAYLSVLAGREIETKQWLEKHTKIRFD